jgi:hypothetical protein
MCIREFKEKVIASLGIVGIVALVVLVFRVLSFLAGLVP